MTAKSALLVLFLNLLCSLGFISAQWRAYASPTVNNLNSISLTDANSGWIVGDKGTILYNTDSGWKEYEKKVTGETLNSIFLLDKNDIWAVGNKGVIIHFDGVKWEKIESPVTRNLFNVFFKDKNTGFIVGEFGTILVFRNGNWEIPADLSRGNFYSVFVIGDLVWVGGGLECINVPMMEMNYKDNLNLVNKYDSFSSVYGMFFLDQSDGWAIGSPSLLIHFNGLNWENVGVNGRFSSLKSINFSDKNTGLSVGLGGTFLTFTEQGWERQYNPFEFNLNGCVIVKNRFYAVGDSGTIISWERDPEINQKLLSEGPGQESVRIFPNPVSGTINVHVPDNEKALFDKITIIDSYGRVVYNERIAMPFDAVSYSVSAEGLRDGFYLLKLESTVRKKTTSSKFIVKH